MHTLNLRLSPDEIGWIAGDAQDRFLVVDDVLLPLYQQVAPLHQFEKVIVFPFSGAPVAAEFADYEALLADADPEGFRYAAHDENDPVAMCYTSGTTGRPKGVVYSHRSTILHTLVASLGDFWGLRGTDVGAAGDADVPRQQLGHALRRGDDGREAGLPRPAPAPRGPAGPDAGGAADLSLGVPTIWMSLIQTYDARRRRSRPPRPLEAAARHALAGRRRRGARALIRAFDRHGIWIMQGWGMTETSPVCTISYPRAELQDASGDERTAAPPWPACRCRWWTCA